VKAGRGEGVGRAGVAAGVAEAVGALWSFLLRTMATAAAAGAAATTSKEEL
jgi:hypothetical protein